MDTAFDQALVVRACSGDKDAFGDLIEKHQEMAWRIAVRMVDDCDIAGELVQEAMLQAYLSLARLHDNTRFRSWFYGIVLNVCRGYIRNRKAPALSLAELTGGLRFDALPFSTSYSSDPAEEAETRELHRTVMQAINLLPPSSREATLLFYYEQLSVREIAAILGVSVSAVKSRLHHARVQLRERLSAEYSQRERMAEDRAMIEQRIEEPAQRSNKMEMEKENKSNVRSIRKVTIADVVQREEPHDRHCVVILLDEKKDKALCIWVGQTEGLAIAMNVRRYPSERPMTHALTASLLQAAGAKLEEVRIEALKGDVFHAQVKISVDGSIQEVDARPSDAIGLAAFMGSPIYVSEEVISQAGMDLPAQLEKGQGLGKGIDNILKEWEESLQRLESTRSATESMQEKEASRQAFWTFVLGSGES
ncbi:MAG: DUF151 domain-containing protein [Chloroflexota bacterium]|nr:DUF151 domain-containing protein [Chloroflexota bacterium]